MLAQSLAGVASSARHEHVETAVLRLVRDLTGADASAITAQTPLMEAGVDSLAATELSSRLRTLAGVALSPTIVFEHPTPRAVATHLLDAHGGAEVRSGIGAPAGVAAVGGSVSLTGAVG